MLRYFPPFPSPNPSALNNPPFENAPIVPSPPSSDSSSMASLPSPPSTPDSPSSNLTSSATRSVNTTGQPTRSRSRSAARRSVPPHTRIVKRESKTPSAPSTPPITPPLDSANKQVDDALLKQEEEKQLKSVEASVARKKSIRSHNYEDAVRIACGAWCESGGQQKQQQQPGRTPQPHKKKTVSWDKQVPA
ncbi:hypothetical protein H072_1919 [Dactylellina haptotyla CBS 200.50]|uniref:Uncharacterized protein n=1 Tax=Dactylellina haptotyla (strain CBS 200.50) TaxID=1284197 RepID=S8C8X1_DACHA|nr:hypothetical protein H072_1919 [Dactylellina haptotyla CBS 200.50]